MRQAFIGIDIGTSSTRAGVFDEQGHLLFENVAQEQQGKMKLSGSRPSQRQLRPKHVSKRCAQVNLRRRDLLTNGGRRIKGQKQAKQHWILALSSTQKPTPSGDQRRTP